MNQQKILEAGKIAKQVREYAKTIAKKNVPLLEIAEKIEKKIVELGGKPAFPTNLSIDNIAAHYTPSHDDKTLAHGLLKVDFGVHVDGWLADNAFSVDLENSDENKKLIEASREALDNAISLIKKESDFHNLKSSDSEKVSRAGGRGSGALAGGAINKELSANQIGKIISQTIEKKGFSPIINLSGHSMEEYDLHAGITIPNHDNKSDTKMKKGLYAIEPFASTGSGKVHDSKPSGIYYLISNKNPRSQIAREILEFIEDEYQTLPFCSRWLVKKLGTKSLIGLRQLEENGNLHHFAQLVEEQNAKVSQAEHTILISEGEQLRGSEENKNINNSRARLRVKVEVTTD